MDAIIQAIILGIVEGITEFLPISSTGHLIVTEKLLGFQDPNETFAVVIQMGAILAVVWYYWRDLLMRLRDLTRGETKFWINLIVAAAPAFVIGFLVDRFIGIPDRPWIIAAALILGGVALWFVEVARERNAPPEPFGPQFEDISTRQALMIGLWQCVALIPGVSRSGASIVGGLLSGLNRVTATAFSFYLGIPVLGAAGLYKLFKARDTLSSLPGGSVALIVGIVVSFITAFLAVSWLLRFVSRNSFKGFAVYRIVAGLLILLLVAVGWLPA